MSKEIITKLDELDNGLKKLSTERKVVLPHHKTFELVDELREIVQNIKSEVGSNE
ncbi:hypothetical protein N9E65_05565 [Gammaproteobacteria bacterium]|jgi:hypothetical protein|nr:hypothetical protein [Gammaproteobacteria bacterium]MDA8709681.1 hypothetical protein [Gammaproteobacteria bacterium]MDA8798336.1 hypothetical protein [Gammaproteobacteria bacterium]MDA9140538.1 hypothetical protein [Gammaproteobacteria bacterium]MDB0010669.1 hypothetical protein [Gammaproteobacteria bacterium]